MKQWYRILLWAALAALLLTGCTAQPADTAGGESTDTSVSSRDGYGTTSKEGTTAVSRYTDSDSSVSSQTPSADSSGTQPQPAGRLRPLVFPSAVRTLEERRISSADFLSRAVQSGYDGMKHRAGTNVVISPYFTAEADGVTLPVYATPVYVANGSRGAFHSFASVDVEFGTRRSLQLWIRVASGIACTSAVTFAADEVKTELRDDTVTLTVSAHGVYTVLLNDSQDTAVTVFVREYTDEDAEIAAYRRQYGDDRVIVYEPGLHEIDYVLMTRDNTVLYLKAGAILLPRHTLDIQSDTDASARQEPNAQALNMLGLNRYPVVNGFSRKGLRILGRGTVDMTGMDWHERRGLVFSGCENATVEGVTVINPCEWSMIFYRCKNVKVSGCAVLGYRTNSDAFAVCNTVGAEVTDCFARTGDDMFEVKTLGGPDDAVCRSVRFARCQAWGSKARCFGVTGEIERDISDVVFEDSIVIWRDAVWDNNRIGSLVVIRENGKGTVSDITFRHIRIYRDEGRAINCVNYTPDLTGSVTERVRFEQITYRAFMPSQCRLGDGSNRLQVVLRDVTANGAVLTRDTLSSGFIWDREGLVSVE